MFKEELTAELIRETDFIGLPVFKGEVLHMNFSRIQRNMNALEQAGTASAEKVYFAFDGYDDVVEEIYEIQPIRRWMQRFVKKYPHFLYFINSTYSDNHVSLLACLCNVEAFHKGVPYKTPNEYFEEGVNPLTLPPRTIVLRMERELKEELQSKSLAYCDQLQDEKSKQHLIDIFDKVMVT